MGKNDYFNGLKRFANKEAKFQQGKLLKNINSSKLDRDETVQAAMLASAKNGVCLPLALHWLSHPNKFKGNGKKPIIFGVQKQHAVSTDPNKRNYGILIGLESQVELAGLQHCLSILNPGDDSFASYISSWINNDVRSHSLAVIIVRFNAGLIGSHAIAVSKKPRKPMEFFDPNVGWYKIYDGDEIEFCTAYVEGYRKLGIELSITKFLPLENAPHKLGNIFKRKTPSDSED